jgi:hypothetical protein
MQTTKPHRQPRRHHYLPEFYSRRWANQSGRMTAYQRFRPGALQARQVFPSEIGFQRDLYTLPGVKPADAQYLEIELFSKIDDSGAKVLDKLLNGIIPNDAKERSDWARFLMAFWYRAPEDLSAHCESYRLICEETHPELDWSSDERNRHILFALPSRVDNEEMGNWIVNMNWTVIDVSGATHNLLTSDQAVIRSNGFAPPDGNYAIPLSPTKLFVANWDPTQINQVLSLPTSKIVALVNKLVTQRARRFVLESGNSQRAFVERHFGTEQVPSPVQSVLDRFRTEGVLAAMKSLP